MLFWLSISDSDVALIFEIKSDPTFPNIVNIHTQKHCIKQCRLMSDQLVRPHLIDISSLSVKSPSNCIQI